MYYMFYIHHFRIITSLWHSYIWENSGSEGSGNSSTTPQLREPCLKSRFRRLCSPKTVQSSSICCGLCTFPLYSEPDSRNGMANAGASRLGAEVWQLRTLYPASSPCELCSGYKNDSVYGTLASCFEMLADSRRLSPLLHLPSLPSYAVPFCPHRNPHADLSPLARPQSWGHFTFPLTSPWNLTISGSCHFSITPTLCSFVANHVSVLPFICIPTWKNGTRDSLNSFVSSTSVFKRVIYLSDKFATL